MKKPRKHKFIEEEITKLVNHIHDVKNYTKDYESLETENKMLMYLNKAKEELNKK